MSFSESTLLKKLQELNNSQQSVQTLSLWLIHHRKHSQTIVGIWLKELLNANNCERKLTLIYLANDILQNSRKKGTEYMNEFTYALEKAVENTALHADDKVCFTIERILNIWKDRKIYTEEVINNLKKILHGNKNKNSESIITKIKVENSNGNNHENNKKIIDENEIKKNKNNTDEKQQLIKRKLQPDSESNEITTNVEPKVLAKSSSNSGSSNLREEIIRELEQNGASVKAPDTNELINILQELEKSASSDAVVREKIAELPSKISDLNALKNLKDKNEALDLSKTVTDALNLLDKYNSRLQQELESRKQAALMLAAFIRQRKQEIESGQSQIEEWQKKLENVKLVKHELQKHLQNLPDLTSIEEAAELTPLPSAGDLFSSN